MPGNPVLVLANIFQFGADMALGFGCVQSRMLLWCITGQGRVTVNGQAFDIRPEAFLFLPWNHAISYHADPQHPFMLAGAHLIPDYAGDAPIQYDVAHTAESVLFNAPARRDAPLPGCDGVMTGTLSAASGLVHLIEYCVTWFQRELRVDAEARMLAVLLLAEITRVNTQPGQPTSTPESLRSLLTTLQTRLAEPFTLDMLAAQVHCSLPTLNRLFQRHLGMSPLQWLIHERLTSAAQLLMTTHLPIGAIGQAVGIHDPYYFSKCFTKRYGMPPTAYRRRMSMLMR